MSVRRPRPHVVPRRWLVSGPVVFLLFFFGLAGPSFAQESLGPQLDADQIEEMIGPEEAGTEVIAEPGGIDILSLLVMGRWLMVPIGIMSMLVVTLSVERLFGLSRRRVSPRNLERKLTQMAESPEHFDVREAYYLTQRNGSSLARVVEAMLSRVGRPVDEIERVASEATQREADRLGGPIRWLHLSAAVTPLMGLFGTVWGMIQAFHDLSQLPMGENKAEFLASGIYIALVTTVAGLAVAIPAAIAAHYFEGRLLRLLHRVEETCFQLAPAFIPLHGRFRLGSEGKLIPLQPTGPRPGKEAAEHQPPVSPVGSDSSSGSMPTSVTS